MEQKHTNRITKWLEPEVVYVPRQIVSAGIICDSKLWEYRPTKRKPLSNHAWLMDEQNRLADKGIHTSIISKGALDKLKMALFR